MTLFHDEEDGSPEPVTGLPDNLPEGECVLWQGRPDALALGLHVFHVRLIAAYFVIATGWRASELAARGAVSEIPGALMLSCIAGVVAIGLCLLLGWLMARSTIYTITTRRVVLRYGVAIRKYINVPFVQVSSASLKSHGKRKGDIALSTAGDAKVAYLHLWPHARPFRFARPEPMLRAIPDAPSVAGLLCEAIKDHSPSTVTLTPPKTDSEERKPAIETPQPVAAT